MRIEEVKTPVVTLKQTMDILRAEGYEISPGKLKAGICQGVYPFGEIIDSMEGLTKEDIYTVYTVQLRKWLDERRVPQ